MLQVRQLAGQKSHLAHSVSLAREEQQRTSLQLETTRGELQVLRGEAQALVGTTAEKRAQFQALRAEVEVHASLQVQSDSAHCCRTWVFSLTLFKSLRNNCLAERKTRVGGRRRASGPANSLARGPTKINDHCTRLNVVVTCGKAA